MQETATKCICHLLLHSSVVSSSLVSHLIIKWANPATGNFFGTPRHEVMRLRYQNALFRSGTYICF